MSIEIKGFITNLGKYNEGELIGEWVTFPIDEDDFADVLERIGINNEYTEYFFTDFENDVGVDFGFSEYGTMDTLNEYAEKLNEWDTDTLAAAICFELPQYVIDEDPNCFVLFPTINSNYDLGYYIVNESGMYDTSNFGILAEYIDYEAVGRDYSFEADGGFTAYGWIERRQ